MPRPILATVNLQHLRHNLSLLGTGLPDACELMAVVKANAYGHGIERIFPALSVADSLALLDLSEAQRCRDLGWTRPILLLEGAFEPDDYRAVAGASLDFTLHTAWQADSLWTFLDAGGNLSACRVHVKVNTGMNRLGFEPRHAQAVMLQVLSRVQAGQLGGAVLMTHFANADERQPQGPTALLQADRLRQLQGDIRRAADLAGLSGQPFTCTLGNSAAAMGYTGLSGDMVRIGIAAYGSSTGPVTAAQAGLKPVMQLRSRLIAVQHLQAGERVGYGSRFQADSALRIGVVACGYADGYPRHAPDGTPILVCGQRTRVVGRVSMDMLTVDLTGIAHADVGSDVTLFGEPDLTVDEVATHCGTIGYELLCAVAPRVPFQLVKEAP
jgi:alanine racemase